MTPLVATLTEADLRDLAAYFARVAGNASTSAATTGPSTPPEATEAPDAGKLARGEHLYRQGDAARGAPPCQGCHGSEATGNPLTQEPHTAGVAYYRTYPALRGQKAAYLVSRLGQYRGGQLVDSSNDFIMQGVAARLDDDSIDAIATWLSSLPPR
ncbi:MAG: c-type cytochrome [Gammaproteobacteria bacterium]